MWLALRIGGTGYLAWLGLRSLARAWSYRQPEKTEDVSPGRPPLARSAGEGFVTNALNPSLATFYLLVIPQFVPRDAPFVSSALLLTAIHVGLAITWHLSWAAAGGTLSEMLGAPAPAANPRSDQRCCTAGAGTEAGALNVA